MAQIRRQEFVVSLADIAANPTKVLAANEFLYVRQPDGKLKMMCGDGVTAISALPYSIDVGAIEQAVIDAETAQGKAEKARDDAEGHAEQTALDRAATGADRAATGADRTAVDLVASQLAEIANSAASAASAANTAATGAERVNISAEQTPTGANVTVTDRNGEQTTVHIDTLVAIDSWEDIKNAVRLGLGARLFPVGYEFTTYDSDQSRNIVWVVRDHDHHTAANGRLEHTMTLETKYVYSGSSGSYVSLVFDATEAFYYAESGLAEGTYHFTVANQAWYKADNGKTFQFTLAQAVPAGGQLVLSMTYNATLEGKSVKTYASANSSTVIETATITEGNGGTDLGTTDGTGNMNYMHRSIFGSNNYAQSAARQWLNSAAAAGSVWTPTNKFDCAPSWATNQKGFMHGLPADFLAVVQPAVVPCRTNSVFEVESLDGTVFTTNQVYNLAEKFFLLSRPEIFGDWDSSSYKDGTQLEYYEELTATERIKRDAAGSARYCWLRSPYPGNASSERFVNTDGSVSSYARHANGVAPACIIA